MGIIYREEKGSPLTAQELDGNFRELEKRLSQLEETNETSEGIGNISYQNETLTITGSFGTDFGSFPLPNPSQSDVILSDVVTTKSPSLPLFEKATLPKQDELGKMALLFDETSPTLIYFNGKSWQTLMKGDIL